MSDLPEIPPELSGLRTLALDLRWTWNHETDRLWDELDSAMWERSRNPWSVLQNVSARRLAALAADASFRDRLAALVKARHYYLDGPAWFGATHGNAALGGIAYFSMEFGLSAGLPLYAGGLGVLAGDYLKTASDLGLPVIGIGLLYQEGYFRQVVDAAGVQHELYPYNEPGAMPLEPVVLPDTGWLKIRLAMPGRTILLRVWQATVGRVKLYLLDSNDPLNSPADRGITAKLYGQSMETRLMQEIVLGVGGWRIVEALHPAVEICHINEGHAAFAVIERARSLAVKAKLSFWQALWATRAGNVFTTHTPVAAAFDCFPVATLRKYLFCMECEVGDPAVSLADLLALGQANGDCESFNMAYLAQRGAGMTLGVSRLHGEVSRTIFQPLFPRWPQAEVPIGHVTNGVHVPSWDSVAADALWTEVCGKERWRSPLTDLGRLIGGLSDQALWAIRGEGRQRLVKIARQALIDQLRGRGADSIAGTVLDPNVLTLGFARRFTDYKRPNLLLYDLARLDAILGDQARPVQIIVAGKADPADLNGKRMITEWIKLAGQPRYRRRVVFLEDYDLALAQELVQGVDVWINTPRRPWEACGTSGMKVLVNGGLNCSVRDGWWDEAFTPETGWAVGAATAADSATADSRDAESLYDVLQSQVIPEFYDRDAAGMPRRWLARIRTSMAALTPAFSSTRMLREYVEKAYLPLLRPLRARNGEGFGTARALAAWAVELERNWQNLHIGEPRFEQSDHGWQVSVPVLLGAIQPDDVRVELFADARDDQPMEVLAFARGDAIPGTTNGYLWTLTLATNHTPADFTVRVVPWRPQALLPGELPLILWQR
ncbi:MAG: alpha-glucan family phosphorylase [Alphaproteobacteria bacterium]|nr:alpha-glucan family phosphorylase [Alphaproteobacteria bacterium]